MGSCNFKMNFSSFLDNENLGQQISSLAYNCAKKAVDSAEIALYNKMADLVDNYYDEYTPERYSRTYAFIDKSFKSYRRRLNGKSVTGGIKVTADGIRDDNYFYLDSTDEENGALENADPWEVIQSNIQGKHGDDKRGVLAYTGTNIYDSMSQYLNHTVAPNARKEFIDGFTKQLINML